jgi:thiol-disulfide isomerase/thioredoxin
VSRSHTGIAVVTVVVAVVVASAVAMRALRPGSGGEPRPVRRVGEAMPDFELRALDGRIWRRADLAGKVAFINVWATWCGPCRQELPLVQRLHDRLRDRPDVVLVAMNVDEDPEKVAPFVTGHGYTFPVLFAHAYVRETLATRGIPRNWVVDRSGVWRSDEIGFDEDRAERWVGDAEAMIAAALDGASAE